MRKQILIGLLIAVALLGLIGAGAALGGRHHGADGDSRQAVPPMDCLQPATCG